MRTRAAGEKSAGAARSIVTCLVHFLADLVNIVQEHLRFADEDHGLVRELAARQDRQRLARLGAPALTRRATRRIRALHVIGPLAHHAGPVLELSERHVEVEDKVAHESPQVEHEGGICDLEVVLDAAVAAAAAANRVA